MEESIITDDFSTLYPDVNRDELSNDESFNCFVKGMEEGESVSSVYGRYLSFVEKIKRDERERVSAAFANRMAAVGSLSSEEPPEEIFFTREQVKSMNAAEIRKNYEKIRKSQKKWL